MKIEILLQQIWKKVEGNWVVPREANTAEMSILFTVVSSPCPIFNTKSTSFQCPTCLRMYYRYCRFCCCNQASMKYKYNVQFNGKIDVFCSTTLNLKHFTAFKVLGGKSWFLNNNSWSSFGPLWNVQRFCLWSTNLLCFHFITAEHLLRYYAVFYSQSLAWINFMYDIKKSQLSRLDGETSGIYHTGQHVADTVIPGLNSAVTSAIDSRP